MQIQELTQPFNPPNAKRLYEASRLGCIQSLKTLIKEDSDIIRKAFLMISSSNIESPLHVSVLHGHLDFVRFLVDLNPELAVEVDALQRTPLHLASLNGEVEIVQALLEKNTSACFVRDFNGLIPLHLAVLIHGHTDAIQELVNARPRSIRVKLQNGQTILHLCVKDNHLEAMKLFSEIILKIHDDDEQFFNSVDNNGNTVLDLSLMLRQVEMVRYLLSIPGIKIGTSTYTCPSNAIVDKGSCRSNNSSSKIEDIPHQRQEHSEGSTTTLAKPREVINCWKKHLKYKGDWLQEVQGTMMLVATVIATVTFQSAINLPGGVWQQDTLFQPTNNTPIHRLFPDKDALETLIPGTAVMAYPILDQQISYNHFLIANTVSFLASMCVIIFIIGRLPLRNRICAWLLTVTMCVAIAFLAYSYIVGIWIVNNNFRNSPVLKMTSRIAIFIWLGMVGMVFFCSIVFPFLVWVVRLLMWVRKRPLLPL